MFSKTSSPALDELKPEHCVWEFTLSCNLRCLHCGSQAGRARQDELTTQECISVVSQLAELDCEVITLTGGEPTLRKDWYEVASSIRDKGILVNMVTNGFAIDYQTAKKMKKAGLVNVAVSIDGTEDTHDRIRGSQSYHRALRTLEMLSDVGVKTAVLTTINTLNRDELQNIHEVLSTKKVNLWRFQLARPIGTMEHHPDYIIAPEQLLSLLPELCEMKERSAIDIGIGDCLGYHSVYDAKLRAKNWKGETQYWRGCQAGRKVLGIESNGNIKGCLSIQPGYTGDPRFIAGNIRSRSISSIWFDDQSFLFNRGEQQAALNGFCKKCRNSTSCRGGAKCMSMAVNGDMQDNPYCYYRLSSLANRKQPSIRKNMAATAASLLMIWGIPERAAANESKAGSQSIEKPGTGLHSEPQQYASEFASAMGICTIPELPPECFPGILYGVTPPAQHNELAVNEEDYAASGPNTISGKIVAQIKGQTRAISGAKVTIQSDAVSVNQSTATDENGNFSFSGIPHHYFYQMTVSKSSFETMVVDDVWSCDFAAANFPDCEIIYRFPWPLYYPAVKRK